MKIKLTADSTCDLSAECIRRCNVQIVPLGVVQDGRMHKDGVDICPEDIFAFVQQGGEIPKTAAVNAQEYREIFKQALAEYEAVIHINISAEFSCCYQNACKAAEGLPVYCVDSRNLSTGSGLLVMHAAQRIAQGQMDAEAIADELRAMTDRVEASFVVDTLSYLRKGGRCSALAALGANMLRLHPCIEVRGGAMGVGKKYRGSFERVIRQYAQERLQGRTDLDRSRVFVTHSQCEPEVVQSVVDVVRATDAFDEIIVTQAGCTISCHCGKGTLGVLFLRA